MVYLNENTNSLDIKAALSMASALKLTGEGIRSDLKTVLTNTENVVFETKKTENCVYSIARYK